LAAALDTSQLIASTLGPGAPAWILALASLRVPWSRARTVTSAPDLAYSSAIAKPSPLLPPVTTAVLPSNRISISLLLLRDLSHLAVSRSISCISAGVKAHPAARTFCSTCSGLVAPAMTLATAGRRSSQLKASSSKVWQRSAAHPASRSTIAQFSPPRQRPAARALLPPRPPAGGGTPRRHLPLTRPSASGRNGIRPIP